MKAGISIVTVLALLFNLGVAPSCAQETTILRGDQITSERLNEGAFVTVAYTDRNGQPTRASGYVKSVGADAFIIGKGLWKEVIAYADVISVELPGKTLTYGSLVRLFAPEKITGGLISSSGDSLVLRSVNGDRVVVPKRKIRKLEVFDGNGNRAVTGGAIGLASGVIAGFIAAGMIIDPEVSLFSPEADEQYGQACFAFLLFTGGGLLIGAGIGGQIRSERWKRANLGRLEIEANRRSKAIGLTASVRF